MKALRAPPPDGPGEHRSNITVSGATAAADCGEAETGGAAAAPGWRSMPIADEAVAIPGGGVFPSPFKPGGGGARGRIRHFMDRPPPCARIADDTGCMPDTA
ncbi:MAG: hypothetical protein LBG06_00620 [Deltaproteobacteria bacterium]|jgi:hypothetical protein|nr:hypothetical protein [Deltaproteobacteria bacterium]